MVSNKAAIEQALIIITGNIYISICGIYLSYVLRTLNKLLNSQQTNEGNTIIIPHFTKKLRLKDFKSLD